jgi:hypothetical protein
MKRIAVWAFYVIGAVAIGYLALSAYAAFTGRELQPGDPIHIFRKPDAPSYSCVRDSFSVIASEAKQSSFNAARLDCLVRSLSSAGQKAGPVGSWQ